MPERIELTTISQPSSWLSKRLTLVQQLLPRMPLFITFSALIAVQSGLLHQVQFANNSGWVDVLIWVSTLPIILITAFLSWRIATRQPQPRLKRMWQWLTVAHICNALGNSLQVICIYILHIPLTRPHLLAVLAYLVFFPVFLLALTRYPLKRQWQRRADLWRFLLDAGIVVISCITLFLYVVLAPVSASESIAQAWPQLTYAIGDLILLIYLLAMLIRQDNVYLRLPLQLLALGLLLHAVGNAIGARELLGGSIDRGRLFSQLQLLIYLPFLTSAEFEYRRLTQKIPINRELVPARGFSILPYIGMIITLIVLLRATFISGNQALFVPVIGAVLLGLIAVLRLISAIQESAALSAERLTRSNESRFQSLVQHSSDIITILDDKLHVRFISPSITRILGYHPEHLTGASYTNLLSEDEQEAVTALLYKAFQQTGNPTSATWRLRSSQGSFLYVESIISNLISDPSINGLVLNTRDLTEREELESQLTHLAFHDSLTHLANRAFFQQQLEVAFARQEPVGHQVGVIFFDLDNFKEVNDTLGHEQGNALLITLSEQLGQNLNDNEMLARLGGDEFAILIGDIHEDQVPTIVQHLMALIHKPIYLNDHEVNITASIGVALWQPGDTPSDLLRNADVAMYAAKFQGGNRHTLFEAAMHQKMLKRKSLQDDLRRAITNAQFVLQYQPIVALDTQEIVGAEALLRWSHPDQGTLSPGEFIALAEENGMIVPIGRWVMQHAFADAAQWQRHAANHAAPLLTINLSSRQMREPHFISDVQNALEQSGIDPHAIMFEITESILVENTLPALDVLHKLRGLGVRLAIDDFGTGYSSLSYLQRMPLDMIKIAQSFVERVDKGEDNYALAQAIFSLGKSLRLIVIAEGIETTAQLHLLRELGCDWAQGYYFAQPMSNDELQQLVTDNRNAGQIAFPGLPRGG